MAPIFSLSLFNAAFAEARDTFNNLVLTKPSQITWNSPTATVATISADGLITAVGVGTVLITATDTESSKTAKISVSVVGSNFHQFSGNGHWFTNVVTANSLTWDATKKAAAAMKFRGFTGHLATLTSQAEADFVALHFPGDATTSYYIGGFQDKTAADYSEPAGGWRWVTGEPFVFTNWSAGEPNDSAGTENQMSLFPDGTWNDSLDGASNSYIVEFE